VVRYGDGYALLRRNRPNFRWPSLAHIGGDCVADELIALIGKRFIQRRDVKAIQHNSGSYEPEHSKFTKGDLREHLAGKKSIGHYLLDEEGNCKLFAYDIDLVKTVSKERPKPPLETWTKNGVIQGSPRDFFNTEPPDSELALQFAVELRGVADGLSARVSRMLDIPTAIAYSGGKGLHVYGFTGTAPAEEVRAAALDVLLTTGVFEATKGKNFFRHTSHFHNVEVEVFPKQDSLDGKKLGNLMRLPLGVNAKSKRASFFVDPLSADPAYPHMDPVSALEKGIVW
jgi:hypothetical protein